MAELDPFAFQRGFEATQSMFDKARRNRLADATFAQEQRELEETQKLNDLYRTAVKGDGSLDRTALLTGAASQGLGSRIPKLQQTFAQLDKAQREAEKERLAQAKAQVDLIGQVAGAATDPQSYAAGLQALRAAGVDISGIPEQYDPAYVQSARQQALTAAQQIEQAWKARKFDQDERQFAAQQETQRRGQDLSASTARRGQDITMRGQDLTDTRAREANALKAAEGKAPTEFQSKAAMFGARAEEADRILSGLDYSPAALSAKQAVSNVPLVGGVLGAAANVVTSPENQRAEQAQRDFINAVLRQESGAVIADSEFDNARKQYFPQPGDSKEVIEQKARNRRTAIEGLKRGAGKAAYSAKPSKPSLSDIFGD